MVWALIIGVVRGTFGLAETWLRVRGRATRGERPAARRRTRRGLR
jgi:hypothetical protein